MTKKENNSRSKVSKYTKNIEKDLVKKMEQYPMLKSAFEQFKIVEALVHEDNISGS